MHGRPNFRRAYFECRYGQLHCSNAFPSTGGFDERVPVVALHDAPGSAASLAAVIAELGADRSVYAPDLPGCGMSDAPAGPVGLGDYALAVADMLASLRLRRYALLGHGVGAAVAVELALARPEPVDRLVLLSPPWARREARAASPAARADGGHLLDEWRRLLASDAAPLDAALTTRRLAERLRAVPSGDWPLDALKTWSARERGARVGAAALILGGPELESGTDAVLPRARLQALKALSPALLTAPPAALIAELRAFLDA